MWMAQVTLAACSQATGQAYWRVQRVPGSKETGRTATLVLMDLRVQALADC